MPSVSALQQQVTAMADQVKNFDTLLNDQAANTSWTGKAADSFQQSVQASSKDFKNCVSELDAAVQALAQLAAHTG